MLLSAITFASPVLDPAKPDGLHKREFAAPYVIELTGSVVTITAPSGGRTVTSHAFHGVVPVVKAEPVKLAAVAGKRGSK